VALAVLVAAGALALTIWRLTPLRVATVAPEARDIVSKLAVIGRVRAPSRALLGAAISGTAAEVRVREGDTVASGDVLLVLEDREMRARVAEAEAALALAEADIAREIAVAERDSTLAERDLERARAILDIGGLTRQRIEQAEQRAADAYSRLAALRAEAPSGGREPARVASARAALAAAEARLALTRVTAPTSGTVLARRVEPGNAVAPGQALLEIAADEPPELVVFPAEENLAGLRVGQPASVSADALPGITFDAAVSLIAPAVDPTQGTVEVRLAIPDPPSVLLPDMTVSVNIELARRAGAAVLPEDAVQGLGTGEPWVGVVRAGRLARQSVRVGLRAEGWVEITSGLDASERAVLGAGSLEVGQRLRIEPPPSR